jgi:hypothetical protein
MQEHSFFLCQRLSRPLAAGALLLAVLALGSCSVAAAQAPPSSSQVALNSLPDAPQPQSVDPTQSPQSEDVTVRNSPRIFLHDEEAIWTSPVRLRTRDLEWLVPLTLVTGAAIATDHRTMLKVVSHNAGFNNANVNTSNVLIGGLIATPVVLFATGQIRQDGHDREAGILGGEAMADGYVVQQVLKLAFWRERPGVDSSRGRFFQSSAGIDSSFPSAHSTVAWSAASAIATEYNSPWVQVAAYSGATAVSLTRVLGQEHFPSDVLVSATAGWLIGHYVVKKHHKIRLK